MIKKLALYICNILVIAAGTASCNSDDEEAVQPPTSTSSAIVTSFSLAKNNEILANLDSVYFSIDLENGVIFNADSLPYGTSIDGLGLKIVTDGCSVTELHVPGSNGADETVINYLTNSDATVNFSNGAVRLHLVSADQSTQRDYKITVNVHKTVPDSLYWDKLAKTSLPTLFSTPTAQKTIMFNGQAMCLTMNAEQYYSLATSPGGNEWEEPIVVKFPFTPDINSLSSTYDAIYILDESGNLHTTQDWTTWTPCNTTWDYIYGGHENTLIGNRKDGNSYYLVTYPETGQKAISDGFPVSGTSQLIEIETKWSASTQVMMIGGKDMSGKVTGDTWGYDGNKWTKINTNSIPGREGMSLLAYDTFKTDTDNWTVSKITTWIALGGLAQSGDTSKDVYISLDQGIHWKRADDLMQLPDYIPAMHNAQALVFSTTMSTLSADGWTEYAPKTLPSWWENEQGYSVRASQPITQWDCPYIYLFGGLSSDDRLYNTVWKGVINRLTFRPLQ